MRLTEKIEIPIIILAGGLGTRLRSVVKNVPKILAPIQCEVDGKCISKPFIQILVQWLVKQGATRLVFSLGYQAEQVIKAIEEMQNEYSIVLEYYQEPEPLGTLGGLAHCLNNSALTNCVVLNGDTFVEIDLFTFIQKQLEENNFAALVAKHVSDVSRYGEVTVGINSDITKFVEKNAENKSSGWINAGVYFFSTQASQMLKQFSRGSLENDFLVKQISQLQVFQVTNGRFIDIGTPESYYNTGEVLREFL